MRSTRVWSAKPVGAQTITTFVRVGAGSALRFALRSPAKTVEAVEVATLFGRAATEARRRAGRAATEAIDAVEVAAVEGRGAGRALRSAELRGFAETTVAHEVVATRFLIGTRVTELGTRGRV